MNGFYWRNLASAAALTVALTAPSLAADGYFLIGYGPRQKALGGAGVADSRDAMSLSINPAGLVDLERQMQLGLTALLPERGYSTDGLPQGARAGRRPQRAADLPRAERRLFRAASTPTSAWGTASYANGGINTSYRLRPLPFAARRAHSAAAMRASTSSRPSRASAMRANSARCRSASRRRSRCRCSICRA